jgi:uncharacterized protein YvpB
MLDFLQFLLKVSVRTPELTIELISSIESVEVIAFEKALIVVSDLAS